ncbi:carbohydrate esterase [Planctomycetota bacterium]|nr:carbohydrate esterase [Planctomycetota bacterium]
MTINFNVAVSETTPKDAVLYISGSAEELGQWDGKGLKLRHDVDGIYRGSYKTERGQVAYKVTRGGWDTVEKAANGGEIENRRLDIRGDMSVNITIEAWADDFAYSKNPIKNSVTGKLIIHEKMKSEYLSLPRNVRVYLPPDYDKNEAKRFPVLYMHDGQNLFDVATSAFGFEWEVDDNAEKLINEGRMESIIVVGIDNTSMRSDEYTPTRSKVHLSGGLAENYAQFLIKELKPFIDETYRTKPEKEFTGTSGSSLGGLISLYLGAAHPEVFSRIGSVSPALGWDNDQIIRDYSDNRKEYSKHWKNMRIWVDMGTLEGDIGGGGMCTVKLAEEITNIFADSGMKDGEEYKLYIAEDGLHNESAWAQRIDKILMYLYPPNKNEAKD